MKWEISPFAHSEFDSGTNDRGRNRDYTIEESEGQSARVVGVHSGLRGARADATDRQYYAIAMTVSVI